MATVTDSLVSRLADEGVRRIFGVPGGECNLDFIASAKTFGIDFILTRTETAAVIMAAVSAELSGDIGVAMTTRGPGLAAALNGVAYAQLDRAPVLVISDGYEESQGYISHQRIDQIALMAPLTCKAVQVSATDPLQQLDGLIGAMRTAPPSPAYLEVCGSAIRKPASELSFEQSAPERRPPDPVAIEAARVRIAAARRPIIIIGLQTRSGETPANLRDYLARTGFPVLYHYKAKGVIPDEANGVVGAYIGGVAEEEAVLASDLIILIGFDPVEGPPQPWRYAQPLVEITEHAFAHPLFTAEVSVVGDIDATLKALTETGAPADWTAAEIAAFKQSVGGKARVAKGGGLSPQDVVDAVQAAAPADCRITVDAGAHMLPVLHLWNASRPNSVLISRGLSTMAFALPAAIASCLTDPDTPVVAFTGDGGLMMCAGELGTAVQFGCKPVVVVFNDSSLTLIGAKQKKRQMAPAGVDFSSTDFAAVAGGFGWAGYRVTGLAELPAAIAAAFAADRAALIDVVIDPFEYDQQIAALRG